MVKEAGSVCPRQERDLCQCDGGLRFITLTGDSVNTQLRSFYRTRNESISQRLRPFGHVQIRDEDDEAGAAGQEEKRKISEEAYGCCEGGQEDSLRSPRREQSEQREDKILNAVKLLQRSLNLKRTQLLGGWMRS